MWEEHESNFHTPYDEETVILAEFFTDQGLEPGPWRQELLPSVADGELALFRKHYLHERRAPARGELTLLDAMVSLRSTLLPYARLSTVSIEQEPIRQTYADLLQKRQFREPKNTLPPTLEEAALTCSAYLRMLGIGEDAAVSHDNTQLPPDTAFLLLTDGVGNSPSEDRLNAFLTDPTVKTLYKGKLTVGAFGVLGSLARLCGGIFLDLNRLRGTEEQSTVSLLLSDFGGCPLLCTDKASTVLLSELGEAFGLRVTYFAKATQGNRFRVKLGEECFLELSIPLLRTLLDGKTLMEATVPTENLKKVCSPVAVSAPEGCYALRCEAEGDCFSTAINTVLEGVIAMTLLGVDRRSLVLSPTYRFPMRQGGPHRLGQALALILGVYRVAIELALPEEKVRLRNEESGSYSLSCMIRSRQTPHPIPNTVQEENTALCYLSFRRTEDGMPDFESVRQSCDLVTRLSQSNGIRSARAVFGSPHAALTEMRGNRRIVPTPLLEEYDKRYCQGWLLELSDPMGLPVLGIVEKASQEASAE